MNTLLDSLKIMLQLTDSDARLEVVELLIEVCQNEAKQITGRSSVDDYIVMMMVVERFNRWGHEGMSSISVGGLTENYLDNYSQATQNLLKGATKLKII